MRAKIRDTEIFFDVDGSAPVPESTGMVKHPTAFQIPRRGPTGYG